MIKKFSDYLLKREDINDSNKPDLSKMMRLLWDRHHNEFIEFVRKISEKDHDVRDEYKKLQVSGQIVPSHRPTDIHADKDEIVPNAADQNVIGGEFD